MTITIQRGKMLKVRDVRLERVSGPHPFEQANERAIAETWAREKSANPSLFNGVATLLVSMALDDQGLLHGCFHTIRYSTLLHWIRYPDSAVGEHVFAHAVPVSADGCFIAIRMAGHTANAGKCYFAAGSFDTDDIRDNRIDVDGNMRREVREEAGLDLMEARAESGYHLWRGESYTVLLRRYRFTQDADAMAQRIRAHVRVDPQPEIEGPVILGGGRERPGCLASHMTPILDWLTAEAAFPAA